MRESPGYSADPRIRAIEWLPWIAAAASFFLFPDYLALGTRILIWILFALSMDLIVGYAGIITLGHSVFFGLGGYVAGILSARLGITDPLVQLVAGAAISGAFCLITAPIILNTRGLTMIMLTLALSAIGFELANKMGTVTGGADGLSFTPSPIFGQFRFDLYGRTAYIYCFTLLFIIWFLCRRLIYSPFGVSLTGLRENIPRMRAIGAPVFRRLLIVYTISATIAGIAGVLLAQTTQLVGLGMLGFEPAGDVLVMVILGGVGRIYGAFVGPVVYLLMQDVLAKQFPEYWYMGIGLMLMLAVMFGRGGILAIVDSLRAKLRLRS